MPMKKDSKIYVAGHQGMVGSALLRELSRKDYNNLLVRTIGELNLLNQNDVENFYRQERPEYVFVAAAKVGGILANNTFRAQFIYENLQIQSNVIHFAYLYGVKKLLFLGSSCIYPKQAPQPVKEEYLLGGLLEETNEPYAIAKIAGIKMCQAYNSQYGTHFISLMPTNLYGPHDNFNLETSHVLPALLRKFHEARIRKEPAVEIWGSGKPRREFLFVEDLARACLFLMDNYDQNEIINIGTGEDISIGDLAMLIKGITEYSGDLKFDRSKPDGTLRKLLDVSRITALGWKYTTGLKEGISETYQWYRRQENSLK
jgi:GDP-L-fucose synthase